MGKTKLRHCLAAVTLSIPMLGANASWVPYSAQYKETTSPNYTNGKQTTTVKILKEIRSANGSLARFEMIHGAPVSGEIWMGCGHVASLNYEAKRATITKRAAPHHMQTPPDPPMGTMALAGLQATLTLFMPPGSTGTVWMAMDSEIIVKLEYHTNSSGLRQDYVKQLESVDPDVVDPGASTKLPDGFSISPSSAASGTTPTNSSRYQKL